MGMTNWQILWQVEIPLAMSVILTGVRVAMVISVGVATIAVRSGPGAWASTSFAGFGNTITIFCFAGAVPAALMALAADFSLGLLEQRFSINAKENRPTRSLPGSSWQQLYWRFF